LFYFLLDLGGEPVLGFQQLHVEFGLHLHFVSFYLGYFRLGLQFDFRHLFLFLDGEGLFCDLDLLQQFLLLAFELLLEFFSDGSDGGFEVLVGDRQFLHGCLTRLNFEAVGNDSELELCLTAAFVFDHHGVGLSHYCEQLIPLPFGI
jgi:hypothetical protein